MLLVTLVSGALAKHEGLEPAGGCTSGIHVMIHSSSKSSYEVAM